MGRRVFLVVLDSVGIGALPDAELYGDEGSNTLAAAATYSEFAMPNMEKLGSIPGLQGSPGTGTGIRLQYCCLENPMDSGVWQAIVHEVAQNWTRLKQLSMDAGQMFTHYGKLMCLVCV